MHTRCYSLWDITANDTKYQYYLDFVYTVSTTRYNNLNKYERFTNDSSLQSVDLLAIMRRMKIHLKPPLPHYSQVITEMGICHSTTKLYKYQNPFSNDVTIPEQNPDKCRSTDTCKISVMPNVVDKTQLIIVCFINEDFFYTTHGYC